MPIGLQNLNETNEPYFEIAKMNEHFPINQLYFCVSTNHKRWGLCLLVRSQTTLGCSGVSPSVKQISIFAVRMWKFEEHVDS
jgi:hypothetical protein